MSASVNVIIYTASQEYGTGLRRDLLGIPGVKIVAEIDDTILMAEAARKFPADIVLVDLDPLPDEILPIASTLAIERRDLSVFAMSTSTDGQLILAAMRAGVKEFLTKPLDPELLAIAFDKVRQGKESSRKAGRLITVVGSAGGVGCTTLATNLAVELGSVVGTGRVALVDLDHRFGHVATLLDLHPSHTMADLVGNAEQVEHSVIQRAMVHHDSGVDVLARPNNFAHADMMSAGHCAAVLVALQQMYDYVVVDGPNRYDVGGKAVFDIADFNLIIIQLLVTSIRNVHRIVDEMRAAGFNMERVKDVENMLNLTMFATLPDEWPTVSSAINMGVPLRQEHQKSTIFAAVHELAEKIHNPEGSAGASKARSKGGLLNKMFSKG
jgi:pilus assembly protein CpaE